MSNGELFVPEQGLVIYSTAEEWLRIERQFVTSADSTIFFPQNYWACYTVTKRTANVTMNLPRFTTC